MVNFSTGKIIPSCVTFCRVHYLRSVLKPKMNIKKDRILRFHSTVNRWKWREKSQIQSIISNGEFFSRKKTFHHVSHMALVVGNKWYLMLLPEIGTDSNFYLHSCAEIPISTNNDDAFRSPKLVTKLPLRQRLKPFIFTIVAFLLWPMYNIRIDMIGWL